MVLRVNSSGAYNDIHLFDWAGGAGDTITHDVPIITNADQGVLVAWQVDLHGRPVVWHGDSYRH
jgi:hypothetical protein